MGQHVTDVPLFGSIESTLRQSVTMGLIAEAELITSEAAVLAAIDVRIAKAHVQYRPLGAAAKQAIKLINSLSGQAGFGTKQVETTPIVAAAGITTSGDLVIKVTAAGMTGSPKDITVPVTTGAHTTAALIAAAVRAALNADADVVTMFIVGGTGANVSLTQRNATGNDGTLNIEIGATGTTAVGVTADATSDNTTAGVASLILGGSLANIYAAIPLDWQPGFSVSI